MRILDSMPLLLPCTLLALIATQVPMPALGASPIELRRQLERLPVVEPMRGMSVEWVARQMLVDNVPMSIRAFRGAMSPDAVVEHYVKQWGTRHRVLERRRGVWRVLATKLDDHATSLHVRADGRGSEGLFVVSVHPTRRAQSLPSDLPLPSGMQLVSRQLHFDGNGNAETLTLLSRRSASATRLALQSSLARAGWRLTVDRAAESVQSGYSLKFIKDKQHLFAFIARDRRWDGRTLALVTRSLSQ